MRLTSLFYLACVMQTFASAVPTIIERNEDLHSSYTYVIVGGGVSGLVVANRLTEDTKTTVLVIEAGDFDHGEDDIYVPGDVWRALGSSYDWNVPSVPQKVLVNGNITIHIGKLVGGGSGLNGMLFVRGSPADYDAWEKLGNKGWGWKGLFPYFLKSETYTPPSPEQVKKFGITWDPSVHGTSGPVHASYPAFIYNQSKNFMSGMNQIGVATAHDEAASAVGAYWVPASIDPRTETRSFARTAYNNPAQKRSNYHILPKHMVTKILTKHNAPNRHPVAYGVEYAAGPNSAKYTAYATKEVIVAAGTVHTPQLLQLSGIGPKTVLKSLGVPVVQDLPGVGSNFQDHPSLIVNYTLTNVAFSPQNFSTNATLDAYLRHLYKTEHKGPYTVPGGSNLAFVPTSGYSSRTSAIVSAGAAQDDTYLDPATDPSVEAGYKKQRQILLSLWGSKQAATIEYAPSPGGPFIIALQKGLSRGTIRAVSTDPFAFPAVDWRSFTNPLDFEMVVDAFFTGRRLMKTPAMAELKPVEEDVTAKLTTREEIIEHIKLTMSPSLSHLSCSAPMMPRELGGVVDTSLRVYGVGRLRVVDASVIPMVPATHIQATVYAIAERAADIIKGKKLY